VAIASHRPDILARLDATITEKLHRRNVEGSGDLLDNFITASATSLCNGAPLGRLDDAEADLHLCLLVLGKERPVALGVVDLELEACIANQPRSWSQVAHRPLCVPEAPQRL